MVLAIDASSPVMATQSDGTIATVTSASFTPPAGSLVVVRYISNTSSGVNPTLPTITDSLTQHLPFLIYQYQSRGSTPTVNGQAVVWAAPVGPNSAAMTITVTNTVASGVRHASLMVTVFTDVGTPTIGATGKAGSTSAAAVAQNYTAQATGGIGLIAVIDWDATGNETAGTGATLTDGGTNTIATQISWGFLRRAAFDDVGGSTNTLNVNLGGTSTNVNWVFAEVLPAPTALAGMTSTNRHPGGSPGTARFFQTPRPTDIASTGPNTVNIDGSLTVTVNRTATQAITHTVGGSLTVTANRSATVAVTHTVGGSLTVTASRTATVAVTHTIGGTRPITVGLSATVAVTHTIGGTRVTTVNRTATVAVTHVVGGSRPITVGLTASIITGKPIDGSRPTTVNRTATIAVTHTIGGSLSVVCVRTTDATVTGSAGTFAQFLPFF